MSANARNPIAADQRRVALVQRLAELGSEIQIVAAALQALDAGEAPQEEELIDVSSIAQALQVSKAAARAQITRRGCATKIGGRLYAPRSAIATIYVTNARGNVAFARSHRDRDASMIPSVLEVR
jgi:hypothetical protein